MQDLSLKVTKDTNSALESKTTATLTLLEKSAPILRLFTVGLKSQDEICHLNLICFPANVNGTVKEESTFFYVETCDGETCSVLSWIAETGNSNAYSTNVGFGVRGDPLFICRANLFDKYQHHIPGYKSIKEDCCNVVFDSKAICVKEFKILKLRM